MPENHLPPPGEREEWASGEPSRLAQSGKGACVQCWIYLTFLRLSRSGIRVELCHRIPESGIVVALTGNLRPGFRAPKGVFLIGVVADGIPHPACHFHILQNGIHARRLPRSAYIPLWPQPGLLPRDLSRGDIFENVYFFGDPPNLAPELRDPSFAKLLKNELGMNLVIAGSERWHDYSEADCVLAVREFGTGLFLRKPATKLYNAWMAGAPMIGGGDSAFSFDGRSGVNYLRCTTLGGVMSALERLKDNKHLRHELVTAGQVSSHQFTPEAITGRWADLLHTLASREAPTHLARPQVMKEIARWHQGLRVTCDRLKGGY